jgi:Ca2+-transporting ATPase
MNTAWHALKTSDALKQVKSTNDGLTTEESRVRLARDGANEFTATKGKSPFLMFFDQFKDFMIVILIGAALVAGATGEWVDAIAILSIILINAVIGFVQEYRAEEAIAALRAMAAPNAVVLRDGNRSTLPASELVQGDIVLLEAGAIIPADLRLLETAAFKVDESALTGESFPVDKGVETLAAETVVADRDNMGFKGTVVTYGRGRGLVVETAMNTEFGKIAQMLQEGEEAKTPLQKSLEVFGKRLALIVLALCGVFFGVGVFSGQPLLEMLLTAVSLAVAAIPEALPALVTVALALGARKLVKQNALIRKLPAVETLGSVTYICTDKTGTLTMNSMEVDTVYVAGKVIRAKDFEARESTENAHDPFLLALALCNDADIDAKGEAAGDPTETALMVFAAAHGHAKRELEEKNPRVAEIPFDSDRKRMTTFHRRPDGSIFSVTKGAVEALKADETTLAASNDLAVNGLRTIGVAIREWDALPENLDASAEENLNILGVVGLLDPPRPEAAEAVRTSQAAGIHVVMITGDHPGTAGNIARRLGILGEDGVVMTGAELSALTLEEFEDQVEHIRVYARVAPEQKLKIIQALQDRGHYVAMTGDGVNDAPALRRADIGVAMGITGTDVAKEAAHLILLDDNFSTIVNAVREGRRVFDNILKFLKYIVTSNSGELWTMFLAPLIGLPIPLLPIHILWINVVTDGLPGLALAAEPPEPGIMERQPRNPKDSVFAGGMGIHIVWVGLLMGLVTVACQWLFLHDNDVHWQTMVFTILCLTQLGHAVAIHAGDVSVFTKGFFANKIFFAAITLAFLAQMAVVFIPFLNPIFETEPLTWRELGMCLAASSVVLVAVEIEKAVRRWRKAS